MRLHKGSNETEQPQAPDPRNSVNSGYQWRLSGEKIERAPFKIKICGG